MLPKVGLPTIVVLCGFLLIAVFYLWEEHRAHLLGALPYVLLLACPLMHFFHGHGGHSTHGGTGSTASTEGHAGGCHAEHGSDAGERPS
jgi:hypothetical protein